MVHKKRTSGIACIFKGTNSVNGPYRDLLLLRHRALYVAGWSISQDRRVSGLRARVTRYGASSRLGADLRLELYRATATFIHLIITRDLTLSREFISGLISCLLLFDVSPSENAAV